MSILQIQNEPQLRFFFCKKMHNFAQFLKRRFCRAAPELAGPERPAQSAQKEACLARRRGGGASARFGGREGVGILHQKPPAGRALSRCIRRARRQKPARMALAASGWGYDVEVLWVGRHGQEWWCYRSVPHRREWRCGLVLLRNVEQGVWVEADHLFTEPVVNMLHRFHHRR
ncbi:Uncharacterised protein [Klebsiella pneumoniae]|nr:Uncharacterised protein [Klebsiella pneumoniae]